jgi:capsule polysaccharide export protein KpsE/RkpR
MHKRTLLLAVVFLLATSLAWAGGGKGKMDPAAAAAKLQAKLGLTDAQTTQVQALYEQTHQQWTALKARADGGEDISAEKKQLHQEKMSKLKSILTAEQFARYEELRAEHKKKEYSKRKE